MFSVKEKRHIADEIQKLLRSTNHPELPEGEIQFKIHIDGAESRSWADISNNGRIKNPDVKPWNERALPEATYHQSADVLRLMTKLQTSESVWLCPIEDSAQFDAAIELERKGLGKMTLHGKAYKITRTGDWE